MNCDFCYVYIIADHGGKYVLKNTIHKYNKSKFIEQVEFKANFCECSHSRNNSLRREGLPKIHSCAIIHPVSIKFDPVLMIILAFQI